MADEHWYVLKVRSGFEQLVAQRLRRLHLEVIIPDQNSILYCRFNLANRRSVTSLPGVIDILGAAESIPLDSVSLKLTKRFF